MRIPFFRDTDETSDAPPESNPTKSSRAESETPEFTRAESTHPDPGRAASPGPGLAARLAEGAKGGFVATLAMTAYRLPVSRSLPPTAEFWSKFVAGGDPDDHPIPAVALHLLYGVAGGVGFGLLAPLDADATAERDSADDHRETARLEAVGLLTGVGYALALSAFGERVVLGRLLDLDLEGDERLVFHAGHVVYGLSLGTWVGSRTGHRR
ncbi:hypothetical protein [Halorussus litoreus]|uniref:hypothetical protein n=1 Tax=Halorussus litoreus TaxID=1710536 RepID=UPI000E2757E2|nr:hypothetical protein [Halorussus litoreus]